jgi:hypothetical protein
LATLVTLGPENGKRATHLVIVAAALQVSEKVGTHATPRTFWHTAAILDLKNGMGLVSLQHC